MEDLARQIAAALGQVGVEGTRVWPALVAQTYIVALFWLIVNPIIIVGSVLGSVWLWKWVRRKADDSSDREIWYAFGIFMTILAGIAVIVALSVWPNQLTAVLYPEAATVRQLLGR